MSDLIKIESFSFGSTSVDVFQNKVGDLFMTGDQIGTALEYAFPVQAISKIYERYEARLAPNSVVVKLTTTDGKAYDTRLYNEKGIYEIVRRSMQPKADAFYDRVYEILTVIRKTGKYESSKVEVDRDEMLAIRRMNAESKHLAERRKQGESLMDVIDRYTGDISKEAKLSLIAKGVELIAGEPVIALPAVDQHFLTCEQIAKRIGLYSLNDKPHKQAVSALLSRLDIDDEERMTVVESTGPWQGTTVKYAEAVIPRLRSYVDEPKKPDRLVLDRVYQVRWG